MSFHWLQRLSSSARVTPALVITLCMVLIAFANTLFPVLRPLDRLGSDALLALDARSRVPPEEIVLIDIDQASLDHPQMLSLAGNWPWPRLVHGELVQLLAGQGAKAVLFDVTFTEPDVFRPQSDAVFAEALQSSPIPVYLPLVIARDGLTSRLSDLPSVMGLTALSDANPDARLPLIAPKALPVATWRTGTINFLADEDQLGRRAALYTQHEGWRIPHIASRAASEQGIALPAGDAITLHWYGQPFRHVSYHQVYLDALSDRPSNTLNLAGKWVIVGATAPGLGDFHPTPLASRTPGPDILATALANLQRGDWLRPVSPAWSLMLAILLVLGSHAGQRRGLHPSASIAVGLAITLVTIGIAYALLSHDRLWQPFSALVIGWTAQLSHGLHGYLQERRKRKQTTQLFGRFLDPQVVRQLTDQGTAAEAEVGRSREVTLLFSDIRGFTTLSERHRPEEIVALLNRYFDLQVGAVFDTGGTLDKYIGDALMAFWGAPTDMPDHAVRAVGAALRMSEQLEAFAATLDFPFEIGIGLHTGPAVVGLIGSHQRLDYTAIGDTVNLASRIEGKTAGLARILVSETTMNACGDAYDFIYHGEFTVKGRSQPVKLFEPRKRQ